MQSCGHWLFGVGCMSIFGAACGNKTSMPGTSLGTFSIVGTTSSNTCGEGLDAPSSWDFDVQLSRDDSVMYWQQDGTTVSGSVDSASVATISDSVTSQIVEADAGVVGCSMTRVDTIVIELGTDSLPTSISGKLSFKFSANAGSDCTSQLAAQGGVYDVIPCTIEYSFTGSRTKAP